MKGHKSLGSLIKGVLQSLGVEVDRSTYLPTGRWSFLVRWKALCHTFRMEHSTVGGRMDWILLRKLVLLDLSIEHNNNIPWSTEPNIKYKKNSGWARYVGFILCFMDRPKKARGPIWISIKLVFATGATLCSAVKNFSTVSTCNI